MFHEEKKINEIINCSKCNERLDDPKALPCGETVCSSCVSTIHVNNSKYECIVCNEQHIMPEKGLQTNKKLLTLISMQPTEVSRGKAFENLKKSLKQMKQKSKNLSFGAKNGIDFIKDYCLNLLNDAQLATEKLIQQINEYNDEFIKEIKEYESSCIKSYKVVNQETKDKFINTADELEQFELKWTEYLKQTEIDDEIISNAYNEASKINERAIEEQMIMKNLILNGRVLKFEANGNKPDKSVIGSLEELKTIDSKILSKKQFLELIELCSLSQKWELIYRASRDGFGSNHFHSKCDAKPNTLVIIKSTNGNIFGGYTEQDWTYIDDSDKNDLHAFLFSLLNKDDKPLIMKPQTHNVICGHSNYGPIFGECSIEISSNSNQNTKSNSNLGKCFAHPNYAHGSNEAKSFLAGSHKFQTVEIEVYTIN